MHYRSIGVTGTREGLSEAQTQWVNDFLDDNTTNVLHHGDCVGVDDQVANLFFEHHSAYIIAHPGKTCRCKAHCKVNDLIMHNSENLTRNRLIVQSVELLLAFPLTETKIRYSGTWYTVEYAKKINIPVFTVKPSGLVTQ